MLAELADNVPANHLPVYRLEAELLKLPQVEMPVEHDFCSGLYARTLHIPAGTVATGAVHASESFFVVRKGLLVSPTDDGERVMRAGDMAVTKAGQKRAVIALSDCVVTTFHANPDELRDEADIWARFTAQPQIGMERVEALA